MEEEHRRRTGLRRNIVFMAVLLTVATIYALVRPSRKPGLSFENNTMIMEAETAGEDESFLLQVPYEDIESLEQRSGLFLGQCLDGAATERCSYGLWENDEFGPYRLCVWAGITEFLVIRTTDGTVVCNYESDEATGSLCEALEELLSGKTEEVAA